jgi:hypothetical protein
MGDEPDKVPADAGLDGQRRHEVLARFAAPSLRLGDWRRDRAKQQREAAERQREEARRLLGPDCESLPWAWPEEGTLVASVLRAPGDASDPEEAVAALISRLVTEDPVADGLRDHDRVRIAPFVTLSGRLAEESQRAAIAIWILVADRSAAELERACGLVAQLARDVSCVLGQGWNAGVEVVDFALPEVLPPLAPDVVRQGLVATGLILAQDDRVMTPRRGRARVWRWTRNVGSAHTGMSVARYRNQRQGAPRAAHPEPARSRWWALLAPAAAALLVVTWVAPMEWEAAVGFLVAFSCVEVLAIRVYLPRQRPLAVMARPVPAVVTSLFTISLFGFAYAAIQLIAHGKAIGVADPELGEAYLIATSMGVAGGLFNSPDGIVAATKVVAHIQLLLFLTTVIGTLAAAFDLLRPARDAHSEPDLGGQEL